MTLIFYKDDAFLVCICAKTASVFSRKSSIMCFSAFWKEVKSVLCHSRLNVNGLVMEFHFHFFRYRWISWPQPTTELFDLSPVSFFLAVWFHSETVSFMYPWLLVRKIWHEDQWSWDGRYIILMSSFNGHLQTPICCSIHVEWKMETSCQLFYFIYVQISLTLGYKNLIFALSGYVFSTP